MMSFTVTSLPVPTVKQTVLFQSAAGITELLKEARASVPPYLWSSTPVVLRATAGLRLLPGEKAQHLLDTVRL